jgi:tetratricopeptide (TPR) repeat protein
VGTELLRRRVPHIAGAYLAAGWILLEFTDWVVNRWVLSGHITDFVVFLWLFMVPAVLLLAWTHGAPGRDRWTRVDFIGVSLNLLAAAGFMIVMFGGRDLGAATSSVTVETEDGSTVQRTVPKSEYVRRVGLFAFRNDSDDPELDWLQFGLPWSMHVDLEQDSWVLPVIGFAEELGGEGLDRPVHLPLARQRDIARDRFLGHLVVGTLERRDDELVVTTRLHDVESGRVMEERVLSGVDPLDLADRLAAQLRQDLGLPSGHIARSPDLPVSELLSDSLVAVRAFFQAQHAQDRDARANLRLLGAATGTDSTFAMAQALLGEAYIAANRPEDAYAAYGAALRHEYRLSERLRYEVKGRYYQLTRQPEKALRVARLRTELYPEDPTAWDILGVVLAARGDNEGAIEAFEEGLALDPSAYGRVQALGQFYANNGQIEDARRTFQGYADRYPDRLLPMRSLGNLYLQMGEFDTAADYFERALLLDPRDFASLVDLADIAERSADFAAARDYYDQAISASGNDERMWHVGGRLVGYFDLQGMTDSAIARLEAVAGYLGSTSGRLMELQQRVNAIALYPRAGERRRALAFLDSLRAELEPPLTFFVPVAEALLYREIGDGRAVEAAVPQARQAYREFGLTALDWIMIHLSGEAKRLQGDCSAAVPLYEEAAGAMQAGSHGAIDVLLGGNPWLGLGMCYRRLGQYGDAEAALRRVLGLLPADARSRYELALVYRDAGRGDEALRHLRGAVHVWRNADPDRAEAAAANALLAEWEGGG